MNNAFSCPHCKKICKTERGLKQHINKRKECIEAQVRLFVAERSVKTVANLYDGQNPIWNPKPVQMRRSARLEGKAVECADEVANGA